MIDRRAISRLLKKLKASALFFYRRLVAFVQKRPFQNFFLVLGLLFIVIAANSFLTASVKKEQVGKVLPKKVKIYSVGEAPVLRLFAKIEKSGVIQIFAQAPGIVQSIFVTEGNSVEKGFALLSLSSNYQGDNNALIARQIAQNQYNLVSGTYDLQKEIIAKNKTLAEKSNTNTDELRNISASSIDQTKSLISLNDEIVNTLDKNLENYTATNSASVNDALILSTKQIKSQFLAANNGLNASLRLTEYQSADDKPQADLSTLQKDITLKQLEIQEKTLSLNLEISRLQLRLAKLAESLMYPASPASARVEKVHINVGQLVNPGTLLFTLSAYDPEVSAEILVPQAIAQAASRIESSIFYFGKKTYKTIPRYISSEATNKQQYSILYSIPEEFWSKTTDGEYVSVDIPIGLPSTSGSMPFLPIDAVYQTQDQAYIFVVKNGIAESKTINLGTVYGRFVEVISGLEKGDAVILDRNIIAKDQVEIDR